MTNIVTVVVTYNSERWIDRCFGSLRQSSIPTRVIAVDNGSTDNTALRLKRDYPEVKLVEIGRNGGFSHANNLGIERMRKDQADYVFLLNHDAWVEPDTLQVLVTAHLDDKGYGVLSPIHLDGSGEQLDRSFLNYISKSQDEGRLLYTHLVKSEPRKSIYRVDFVNAAAWLVSLECVGKVGAFDESIFFMYGEDNNYLQRVHYHGFRVGVVPSALIYHDREDREGSASQWKTGVESKLLTFKVRGGDIRDDSAPEWMRSRIRATRRRAILSLITLRLNRYLAAQSLLKELRLLYVKILKRRQVNKAPACDSGVRL